MEGLNQFHSANLTLDSDVDQDTFGKMTKYNTHDSQEVSHSPAGDHKATKNSLCKACEPKGGGIIFGLSSTISTNLVEVFQMMLHTKYQGSRPCGFIQEDFFMFLPIKAYVKPVIPGAGPFWPQGYYLNKLGRGPLDDTTD